MPERADVLIVWTEVDAALAAAGADESYPPLRALRRWQASWRGESRLSREERDAVMAALRAVGDSREERDRPINAAVIAMDDPEAARMLLRGERITERWLDRAARYMRARDDHPDDPDYWPGA